MFETLRIGGDPLVGPDILRNATPARLYEHAVDADGAVMAASGALVTRSGEKTGRSPGDKRVVHTPLTQREVWWGPVNRPVSPETFQALRRRALDYLGTRERLYVVDGFAGWDTDWRIRIRVVCARPYHALFMHNMLIRPSQEELTEFAEPDYVILNAGEFPADPALPDIGSQTAVSLDLERRELVILGTQYAGEMKKGVFTIMNYLMPRSEVLPMHCSVNEGAEGDVSVFFGLSGTGKTTLSAEPRRRLIGDDEHCWTDQGVFNIEGGCYAKCIDLSPEQEPEIHGAIRFGTVLENTVLCPDTRRVDFTDASITQNTRAAYPIEFIPNAKVPGIAAHPQNIILLTCDAFGVLPPVSRLTPEQAMYHFINGYTAKVAGTEVGVSEPEATFSACFGAAFLAWHPNRYAELLGQKLERHGAAAWLVNTGWTGGPYGTGRRISIAHTRAIIDAIHAGDLDDDLAPPDRFFGLRAPRSIAGCPDELLAPEQTWADPGAYERTAKKLVRLFEENHGRQLATGG
ncbi:MAG: phosphoenolpyruvate carboxykinase (ATP) [Myxococcota bacterium]